MNIRFEPEKRDVSAALRLHGHGFRRLMWLPLAMAVLGLFCLIIAVVTKQGNVRVMWAQVYPVFIIAAIFIALWQWVEHAARKNIRAKSVFWQFGEEEAYFESDNAKAQLKWPSFLYYKEGKDIFLLYPQKNIFHFIPKRVLTEDQVVEFRGLLANHVSKK